MIGMRNKSWRRFGASLTGLALGLQLMLSSLGLVIAASADPSAAFSGHALCLAGGGSQPADSPAVPAQNHAGFCCLWHQIAGVEPVAAALPVPLVVAYAAPIERGMAAFTPGPQRG